MDIKNWVFGIGIMILTIFVAVYGLSLVYPQVNYDDYCSEYKEIPIDKPNKTICPAVCVPLYEIEDKKCVFNECGSGCGADGLTTFETKEECEEVLLEKTCYDRYNSAREVRSKKIFYFSIPIGIIILFIGSLLFSLEAVGAGLMGGGIGIIIYGAGGYWRYGDDLFRFIISLLGLAAVIYLTYWFNNQSKNKKKFRFLKKKR